jgi:hypothetical protein
LLFASSENSVHSDRARSAVLPDVLRAGFFLKYFRKEKKAIKKAHYAPSLD